MYDTPKKKINVPLFGKLAVKHNFISKEQLKRVLRLQEDEKKEGKETSLPEIFAKTGIIPPDKMGQLHQIVSDYKASKQTGTEETVPSDSTISLAISEDKLTASLIIPPDYTTPVSYENVLDLIHKAGITFGVVKDYIISNHVQRKENYGTPLVVAKGTPPYDGKQAEVRYLFDTSYYRQEGLTINGLQKNPTATPGLVDDGDLLAEKTHMIPSDSGQDIFGNPIPANEPENIILRSGMGTEIFEDQLKIFAKSSGTPVLSIEGKVSVFPDVMISGDYGVTSGPVERESNITASGIITGEYPIKGGSISAKEIRHANIDILGDINVTIGITESKIKTQGDIRARYIRGATIETTGSVIVENEIMDSKIFASGICITKNSKIITSTISANRGVKSCGIGTKTSIPCEIYVGADINIQRKIEGVDKKIQNNTTIIGDLTTKVTDLENEKNQINSKISPLMKFHRQAEKAIQASELKIEKLKLESTPKQLIPVEKNLHELKSKDNSALNSIRIISKRLKEITGEAGEIPAEISSLKKEIEDLKLDKKAIMAWSEKNLSIPRLEVSGDLVSGTIISGNHANLEIKETQQNVLITERNIPTEEDTPWVMQIKKLSSQTLA